MLDKIMPNAQERIIQQIFDYIKSKAVSKRYKIEM